MERSGSRILLKVLSGPHTGAEMPLAPGRHVIGSDDSCDIILADPAMAPQHAAIVVEGSGCSIESLDNALVVVDGTATARTSLKSFQSFTLGTTHLATGPADEPWPAVTIPEYQVAPPAQSPPAGDETAQAAAPADVTSAPQPAAPAAPPDRRTGRSGTIAALIAAVAILLAFLFFAFSGAGDDDAVAATNDTAAIEQQLKGLLQDYTDGTDLQIENEDGELSVLGYVATADVRKKLRGAVEEVSPTVDVRVYDTASLADAAQRILAMYKVDLQAVPGGPGEVIVTGAMADVAPWQQVKPIVTKDVPRIAKLSDRVNQPVAAPEAVPTDTAEPVAVTPIVQRPATQPVAVAPESSTVSLAIQSVTVGNGRWIVLASGERVFLGGQLASGHVVTGIEKDHVVLALNGQQTIVTIGGR